MYKSFNDLMPDLQLPDEIRSKIDNAEIIGITLSHDRETLKVEILADDFIGFAERSALAAHIKKQLFSGSDVTITVEVSARNREIKAGDIFREFYDDVLLELKIRSYIEYDLINKATLNFSDNVDPENFYVEILVTDTVVNRTTGEKLVRDLEDICYKNFHQSPIIKLVLLADAEFEEQPKEEYDIEALMESRDLELLEKLQAEAKEQAKLHKGEKKASAPASGQAPYKRRKASPLLSSEQGYGKDFEGLPLFLYEIDGEMGEVIVRGDIVSYEERALKNENLLFSATLTDYTDSIKLKLFVKPGERKAVKQVLEANRAVLVCGEAIFDTFDHEVVIQHIKGIKYTDEPIKPQRKDTCEEKRIELHCHTNMSDMDGMSDAGDIVKAAAGFGHPAIAITDHGVVQAFPTAAGAAGKLKKAGKDIKVIYGLEGYLVNVPRDADYRQVCEAQSYHIILLAKNETGRVNLYRMVSESHLNYFYRRPRLPRWLLEECREGIIVGSACEAGELFRAILKGEPDEELDRIADFYDYLEIQPIGNNAFLKRDPSSGIKDDEALRNLNRKVVEIGDRLGKPVVATGDVHFLNPEDELYRRILMKGKGFDDADLQPPLYLHTTDEMLEEFSYLGGRAHEVVIDNPHKIAELCEVISPTRPDKCPPVIEGSDVELREMCYRKAKSIYGDPLPEPVETRLSRELSSIIDNGYAVLYIIAQRLVKKSNDDGYLVGSRGSVGSSLAATMSDITEVNPLPPHYICRKCKYSDFDSPQVKAFAGRAGADMPDAVCPVCGEKLYKDGFDIPFETFMGFHGDKEPDIDLNFSGEYQSKAHAYTEELFGKGYTFKAGTVSTVSDKTAWGYVHKYFEEKGVQKRRCEIERIAANCMGVRTSTGQHPGGIVVMPRGENIYTFTPIQHPANDMKTNIVTTHFDYHSIDQNLLKLDILGHDDPTMIRCLQDLTGIDPRTIPLDDPEVMQLFIDTSSLKIKPEDIGGSPLGTLGVPEFGTDFAMQMVIDAQPRCISDLILISGLAHGTDVWMGNARDLILDGTTTLRGAICTRDDIMLYLISKGVEPEKAFKIMETVRKGMIHKGKISPEQWAEYRGIMEAANVPEWYIKSCEKIQYMFPKAHAAAYVMMAWRVAYCKVHYPREYYAAYFSIRADGLDYEKMCMGRETIAKYLEQYRANKDRLTDKEELVLRDMRIAEEMYARGIEFTPIDLYQANAKYCRIVDGKIMPGWSSIAGLGEKAAESLAAAAKGGRFLSREDVISRGGISTTIADTLARLGILGGMPQSNQLSLFDIMFEKPLP